MSGSAMKKVFIGLIIMFFIVSAGLFMKFERQSHVNSESGYLDGEVDMVAIDYSGIVSELYVGVGDEVDQGDTLATVKSARLIEKLNNSVVSEDDLIFDLNNRDEMVITAPRSGRIHEVNRKKGAFLAANTNFIAISDPALFVKADFVIPRSDFYNLNYPIQANIYVDNRQISGKVDDFIVNSFEDSMVKVTAVISPESVDDVSDFTLGTPVVASINVRRNPMRDMYAQMQDMVEAQNIIPNEDDK